MDALCFQSPGYELLARLTEEDWKKALKFTDRTQLTLPLGLSCREHLPDWVRSRIDGNLRNTAQRWERIKTTYRDLAAALAQAGLEFVVLKGFSHCPRFVRDPRHRWQGDIDLLLPREQARQAFQVATRLGYEPITPGDEHPLNHLPTLIRKTGWQWRGEDFDVDIPISIELHFQPWHKENERFGPSGLEQFWERRQEREVEGLAFAGLHPADEVGNASLHLLRHLLHGNLRPSHVYELAWMLHQSAEDVRFWNGWHGAHHESLRRIEAICSALAQRWFDCRLPQAVSDEVACLPLDVQRWLDMFSASPLAGKFRPNKDELWLHWSLLDSRAARLDVARRRLLPERLPGPVDAVHVAERDLTWRTRLRSRWRYLRFASKRASHHLLALAPTAWSGLRWFISGLELGPQFWRFYFSEAFYDFGMFVFFFLYNLYLLRLGFREDFLGLMSGLMTAGSVAGSILSVFVMQRFGIRRTLMAGFALTAIVSALRVTVTSSSVLLALAPVAGLVASAWPVALAPMVASVTTEKSRAFGFSFTCSAGIAMGIFGNLVAGRLPGWFSHLPGFSESTAAYRGALLVGCGIVLLALWPLSRVRADPAPPTARALRRPSPRTARFLIAMAVWSLGTSAFNPFHSVYFANHIHSAVEQIGYIFSAAQFAQVVAILLAPLAFRRFGLTRGISNMEFATAVAMLGLASAGGAGWAATAYVAFMAFQYMSEPGMFTTLMEGLAPQERNSASALNFLVSFICHAVAAALSGWLLAHYGYPPVLVGAALTCVAAAFLFRVLLSQRKPSVPSAP